NEPLLVRITEREILMIEPAGVTPEEGSEGVQVDVSRLHGPALPFTRDADGIIFFEDGRRMKIARRPPIIGTTTLAEILAHSPIYKKGIEIYVPADSEIAQLAGYQHPVEVEVFFGTWCPHCRETVPKFIKIVTAAANPNIQVVYTGVPAPPFTEFAPAKEKKIKGVPTFIISGMGREIGRFSEIPAGSSVEHELLKILADYHPQRF
ncbi:MAG TPA: thioredoxin family protein, partial [Candidatus Polarisedimenticolia bacterium]|nr:thioredoxin family protein [Candidatus Polarisedimenticolia bacterium]